jgi:hypothetical protein
VPQAIVGEEVGAAVEEKQRPFANLRELLEKGAR